MANLSQGWKLLARKLGAENIQLRKENHKLKVKIAALASRKPLPDERHSITKKVMIGVQKYYLTKGFYDDGTLGEIFIRKGKHGAEDAIYGAFAAAISIGLQWGIPLKEYTDKFFLTGIGEGGPTNDPEIPLVKGFADYLARHLALKYLSNERKENASLNQRLEKDEVSG